MVQRDLLLFSQESAEYFLAIRFLLCVNEALCVYVAALSLLREGEEGDMYNREWFS